MPFLAAVDCEASQWGQAHTAGECSSWNPSSSLSNHVTLLVHKCGLCGDSRQGLQPVASRAGLKCGPRAPDTFLQEQRCGPQTHHRAGMSDLVLLPLPLDSFLKVPECDARASLVTSLSSLMVPCDDWLADSRAHWEVIPNEVVNVCWMSQDCTLIPVTTTHYWGRVLIAESWHKQGLGLLMVQGVPYGILCPPQCWA